MYTEQDKKLLNQLGFTTVTVEQGTVRKAADEATLIYAPHAPKSVYETLLRGYWTTGSCRHIILLGNDLKHYPDIYSNKRLEAESPCILLAGPLLSQASLPSNFEHNNVFNDLAFQWFKAGTEVEPITFENHAIEKENFEINKDDI
jgi:hypothetical protein